MPTANGHSSVLQPVPCDLCGSEDATEVYASTIKADGAPSDYFSSSRSTAAYGRIVRCESCGLVRTSPRDHRDTLRGVYGGLQDSLYDAESDNRSLTAAHELQLVERYARPPGRLLDVGCATGIFLARARERGWRVEGIEASAWAVRRARERFDLSAIHEGFVEDASFSPASYDVITMYDVLEHVDSPTGVLERLHAWLRPGGFLFLNVPNFDSPVSRVLRRRWPLLLREHLWYFSPPTVEQFLAKTGFELVHTRPNRVTFSVSNVFRRLEQYGGGTAPLWHRLSEWKPAKNSRVRFPIGELNVVARRGD